MLEQWRTKVQALKADTYALYLAARDPRVPRLAKLVIVLAAAYALSPIDLIPDFIPVLGYLDDLLILPFAIMLAVRLIPADVWQDCRSRAAQVIASELPVSRKAAAVIVIIWVLVLGLTGWVVWGWVRRHPGSG